jgi:hypothetical protein
MSRGVTASIYLGGSHGSPRHLLLSGCYDIQECSRLSDIVKLEHILMTLVLALTLAPRQPTRKENTATEQVV